MTEILLMLGGIGIGFSLCIGLIILLMVKLSSSDEEVFEEPDTVKPDEVFFFGENSTVDSVEVMEKSVEDEEVLKAIALEQKLDEEFEKNKEEILGNLYDTDTHKDNINEFFRRVHEVEAYNLKEVEEQYGEVIRLKKN